MSMWTTAMAGAAAGLGVAMPLGAVGVLLIQQGMRDRRGAVAAAAAVAVVDCSYAAVATALGPLVASALSGVEAWVRLVSAAVLAVIAVRGLLASRRPRPAVASEGEDETAATGAVRTFTRFAAITLINPTTALYFAALTTAQGATLSTGAAGAVFVGAVFLASLGWQQLLVAASGFAGTRISDTARAWTFRIGYGLVAVYAVRVALPLP
ncbi:LysE family transporter [Streptomyces sp. NBC_01481]|uniref:LysE family transporter n=1 Tax=Streptomyces sp. NBC_01481 TaxID=2975869 RepID=UPI0022536F67|nr:LysE family transporter [Streptomyces sp. NBC_01481]MCX4582332.1 LysE family transporter [Streptomyces sp. NBC_01481]